MADHRGVLNEVLGQPWPKAAARGKVNLRP